MSREKIKMCIVLLIAASRLYYVCAEYLYSVLRSYGEMIRKGWQGDTMFQVVLNVVSARVTYCASTRFQEEKDQVEQCIHSRSL